MKHKLMWIFGVIPMILVLIMLPSLPDIIAVNYNLAGKANAFSSKYLTLLFGILPLLTSLIPEIYLYFQTKKAVTEKDAALLEANRKTLINVFMWCNLFFIALTICFLVLSRKNVTQMDDGFPMSKLISGCMGLLMIIAGNLLPKARRNAIFGIRMKWTFYNDTTWNKSHRFGGILFVAYGILQLLGSILLPDMLPLYLLTFLLPLVIIIIFVYSYKIYKEETNHA